MTAAPRVAIFGCGRMGAVRAEACRTLGAQVAVVQDTDEAAAARLAAGHPDCRIVEHVAAVDWDLVDAAFVCTPPVARGPAELAAIGAGIPVFMEKPLGLSAEHADAMARALRRTPVRTSVGYQNRYRPSVRRLRAVLSQTPPYGLAAQWVVGAYRKPWWLDPAQSGGPINEQATHVADLCRHLAGEIVEVTAVARDGAGPGAVDTASIALRFAGGACASLLYSYLADEKHVALEAFWAGGHARLEGWDFHEAGADVNGDPNEVFVTETAAFLGVGGDTEVLCDFEDALRTQQAMDAIGHALARTRAGATR